MVKIPVERVLCKYDLKRLLSSVGVVTRLLLISLHGWSARYRRSDTLHMYHPSVCWNLPALASTPYVDNYTRNHATGLLMLENPWKLSRIMGHA